MSIVFMSEGSRIPTEPGALPGALKASSDTSIPYPGLAHLGSRIVPQTPGIDHGLLISRERGNLNQIIRRRNLSSPGRAENRDLYKSRSGSDNPDPVGRLPGKIDDAPGNKGPSVIHKDIHGAFVGQVCHANFCPQRKRSMGSRQVMFMKNGSTGRLFPIKGRSVP